MKTCRWLLCGALLAALCAHAESSVSGRVVDPQGNVVAAATVTLQTASGYSLTATSDAEGHYRISAVHDGDYQIQAESPGLSGAAQKLILRGASVEKDVVLSHLATQHQSIVITANKMEPAIDLRNAEVFNRTLFTRDDQVLQQLNAGINAGQHEGGGKSLEIRRFGFNLDHGGVNGGLKVLVDDVQQNQGTQGHGQGYLGALKALSPELIQDVTIINGPFSAEYGDFSGLGVVHIRQRESLPEQYTVRLQGGNFNTGRGFLAFSPDAQTHRCLPRLRRLLHRRALSKSRPLPPRQRQRQLHPHAGRRPEARLPLPLRPQRLLFLRPDSARSGRRRRCSTASATSIPATAAA